MGIFDKPINQIDEDDLRGLCENKIREKRRLDYKRELPGGDDSARREFAYDIASFANAAGGMIFYGVAEEDGAATEVVGLDINEVDAQISRLQQIVLNGIDPRIAGLQVESDGRPTIIVSANARPGSRAERRGWASSLRPSARRRQSCTTPART